MKKIFVSFIVLMLLTGFADAQRKKRRQTVKPPPIIALPERVPDKFEKYIDNYEISADGKAVEIHEILFKFETPYLKDYPFKPEFVFNSDLQELEVLEAYKINKDGTKVIIGKDKISIKRTPQAEAAPAFSSLKILEIDYGKINTGDKYYYKTKRTDLKTYFDGKFSDLLVFNPYFSYETVEVNVKTPKDFPLTASAEGLVGGKVSSENGNDFYQWTLKDFKGKKFESGETEFLDKSLKLSLSNFKSYQELADFYRHETEKRTNITPEIQALADKITTGYETPQEKASAIYLWVNKNIRYLSIVLDRGGWIPHSAESILRNGYGDCKDYSTLIQTLLKAKGIESSQVLVRLDQNFWFPDITLPETFNHVILYIPTLDLYADATASNTRLGLISSLLRGKKSVIVDDQAKIVIIPDSKPEDNQFISDVAVKFNGLGDVQAVSNNTYIGESEMIFRPVFADSESFVAFSEYFIVGFLEYFGMKGTGKILNVSDSHKVGKPFNVEMEVNFKNYTTFQKSGSFKLPTMLNLSNIWEIETKVLAEKKDQNFYVGALKISENFNLQFPDEIRITKVPADIIQESPYGKFSLKYQLTDNIIEVKRELILNKGLVEPNEYASFKQFVQTVVKDYDGTFQYRTNPRFATQKLREKEKLIRSGEVDFDDLETLSVKQVNLLESNVTRNPNDTKSRKRLIRFYLYETDTTLAQEKKLLEHQIWFIQNQPREGVESIFGYYIYFAESDKANYEKLKTLWLQAVKDNSQDALVLYNAIQFFVFQEPEFSRKLNSDGEKLFPERFEFPIREFVFLSEEAKEIKSVEERKAKLEAAFRKGEFALELLKKERSIRRDIERGDLLPILAEVAFELEKYDKVTQYARELILEFGSEDESASTFAKATHNGNILLGKVAAINGETEKAKEHLLTAIKAPLRVNSSLDSPDLELAETLLILGEKETVLEYLKLCEELKNSNKLILKKWQAEIKQGKKPNLNWYSDLDEN